LFGVGALISESDDDTATDWQRVDALREILEVPQVQYE
jgi:hypothetical protein